MSYSMRRSQPHSEEEQTPLDPTTHPLTSVRHAHRQPRPPRQTDRFPTSNHDSSTLSRRSTFHHGPGPTDLTSQASESRFRRSDAASLNRRQSFRNPSAFPARQASADTSDDDRSSDPSRRPSRHRSTASAAPSARHLLSSHPDDDDRAVAAISRKSSRQRDIVASDALAPPSARYQEDSSGIRPTRQPPTRMARHPQVDDSGANDRPSALPSRRQSFHNGAMDRGLDGLRADRPTNSRKPRRGREKELNDEKTIQMAYSANKQRIENLEKIVHDLSRQLNSPKSSARKPSGQPPCPRAPNATDGARVDRSDDQARRKRATP